MVKRCACIPLRRNTEARVPFALVAVILMILAGVSAAYISNINNESGLRIEQQQQIARMDRAITTAHDHLTSYVYGLVGAAVSDSSIFHWDLAEVNKKVSSEFNKRLATGYKPARMNGFSLSVEDAQVWVLQNLMKTGDYVPTGSGEPSTSRPAGLDLTVVGTVGLSETFNYIKVTGSIRYVATHYTSGTTVDKRLEVERVLLNPMPFLVKKVEELQFAAQCESCEIALLTEFMVVSLAQYRVLNGVSAGVYEETDGGKKAREAVVSEKDVEVAVNLAILLYTARQFRTFDLSAPAVFDQNTAGWRSGNTSRAMTKLLDKYLIEETIDPSDLFALYKGLDETRIKFEDVFSKVSEEVADFFLTRILDYLGLYSLLNVSYDGLEMIKLLANKVSMSVRNAKHNFQSWFIAKGMTDDERAHRAHFFTSQMIKYASEYVADPGSAERVRNQYLLEPPNGEWPKIDFTPGHLGGFKEKVSTWTYLTSGPIVVLEVVVGYYQWSLAADYEIEINIKPFSDSIIFNRVDMYMDANNDHWSSFYQNHLSLETDSPSTLEIKIVLDQLKQSIRYITDILLERVAKLEPTTKMNFNPSDNQDCLEKILENMEYIISGITDLFTGSERSELKGVLDKIFVPDLPNDFRGYSDLAGDLMAFLKNKYYELVQMADDPKYHDKYHDDQRHREAYRLAGERTHLDDLIFSGRNVKVDTTDWDGEAVLSIPDDLDDALPDPLSINDIPYIGEYLDKIDVFLQVNRVDQGYPDEPPHDFFYIPPLVDEFEVPYEFKAFILKYLTTMTNEGNSCYWDESDHFDDVAARFGEKYVTPALEAEWNWETGGGPPERDYDDHPESLVAGIDKLFTDTSEKGMHARMMDLFLDGKETFKQTPGFFAAVQNLASNITNDSVNREKADNAERHLPALYGKTYEFWDPQLTYESASRKSAVNSKKWVVDQTPDYLVSGTKNLDISLVESSPTQSRFVQIGRLELDHTYPTSWDYRIKGSFDLVVKDATVTPGSGGGGSISCSKNIALDFTFPVMVYSGWETRLARPEAEASYTREIVENRSHELGDWLSQAAMSDFVVVYILPLLKGTMDPLFDSSRILNDFLPDLSRTALQYSSKTPEFIKNAMAGTMSKVAARFEEFMTTKYEKLWDMSRVLKPGLYQPIIFDIYGYYAKLELKTDLKVPLAVVTIGSDNLLPGTLALTFEEATLKEVTRFSPLTWLTYDIDWPQVMKLDLVAHPLYYFEPEHCEWGDNDGVGTAGHSAPPSFDRSKFDLHRYCDTATDKSLIVYDKETGRNLRYPEYTFLNGTATLFGRYTVDIVSPGDKNFNSTLHGEAGNVFTVQELSKAEPAAGAALAAVLGPAKIKTPIPPAANCSFFLVVGVDIDRPGQAGQPEKSELDTESRLKAALSSLKNSTLDPLQFLDMSLRKLYDFSFGISSQSAVTLHLTMGLQEKGTKVDPPFAIDCYYRLGNVSLARTVITGLLKDPRLVLRTLCSNLATAIYCTPQKITGTQLAGSLTLDMAGLLFLKVPATNASRGSIRLGLEFPTGLSGDIRPDVPNPNGNVYGTYRSEIDLSALLEAYGSAGWDQYVGGSSASGPGKEIVDWGRWSGTLSVNIGLTRSMEIFREGKLETLKMWTQTEFRTEVRQELLSLRMGEIGV